jgi:cell division protein FtsL
MRGSKTRSISLFNVLVVLFISAGVIVFFVNNIITVNNIVVSNNNLRNEINAAQTVNNNLQTEIERVSNLDNIKPVAIDKLKLGFSGNRPKKISVEKSDLEN